MSLKIVGAGVGRTGTHSLKVALERLLGGTCHHMMEVFSRPEQSAAFTGAIDGEDTDWVAVLRDFSAIVDFPGTFFWREIAAAHPDALILLSTRDAHDWYRSASNTIFIAGRPGDPWMDAVTRGFRRCFSDQLDDEAVMIAAYEAHNAAVRAEVPKARLIDWTPGDGWGPICAALGVAIPDEPFPVTNTMNEFRAMLGVDPL